VQVNQGQVHADVRVIGNAFQQGSVDAAANAAALGLWATAGVLVVNNTVTVPSVCAGLWSCVGHL
jgi:uracil DNA glycosylase